MPVSVQSESPFSVKVLEAISLADGVVVSCAAAVKQGSTGKQKTKTKSEIARRVFRFMTIEVLAGRELLFLAKWGKSGKPGRAGGHVGRVTSSEGCQRR